VEAEAIRGSLLLSAPEQQVDWLVLTASNRAQARGYREQLSTRRADGRLDRVQNWMVVPDPGDRRVGSGGSTCVVLHELARRLRRMNPHARGPAELFRGKKILVIHSGGDSRRLPAYAAEGKVFTPLPCDTPDGRPATLFDLVLADLAAIPIPDEGRVVIATGDVLLGIGRHAPDLAAKGMVGVAFPGSAEVGSRHGVYVRGRGGRVTDFLQKPDRAEAKRRRALDSRGRVLIDTGVLSLDPAAVAAWIGASRGFVKDIVAGRSHGADLYQDMLPQLVSAEHAEPRLDALYRRLRTVPFHVSVVPPCDFLHIGSTRELVNVVTRDARVRRMPARSGPTVFNCAGGRACGPRDSIAEACRLGSTVQLGHQSVLVGYPGGPPLDLPDGWGMAFLPVGTDSWSCVAFGVADDAKTPRERGGTFGGQRIDAWMDRLGVADEELFPRGADRSLWSARLWTVGGITPTLRAAQWMIGRPGRAPCGWRRAKRLSLAELLPKVNLGRLIAHRAAIQREECLHQQVAMIASGVLPPVDAILRAVQADRDAARISRAIRATFQSPVPHFTRARLLRAAAELAREFPRAVGMDRSAAALDEESFACIARGVARSVPIPASGVRAAIRPGEWVRVTCPVRIDLAGGWSDTPPICHELGGAVVNAAITLDGRHPVQVTARLIDEPVIRLRSDDLGQSVTITASDEAQGHHDPHDWAALPKAALMLAGISPRRAGASLARRLRGFGGGLELTMSVAVPKGSGLGTSSILGAAVLACLDRVCGKRAGIRSLIRRTSVLEQMMSTAGGWQDQAGGITPGIKLLRTRPGPDQVPSLLRITPPARAMRDLQDRGMLYYTGQRRLAKDILQGVVRRYLSGDAGALQIIHELKAAAEEMSRDLRRGDVDAFARGVLRNWELKKAIDPGSTNARIEAILRPLLPRLAGYELAGAGGGGFIFMIARSPRDAAAVRRVLGRRRTLAGAGLMEFAVDDHGMVVDAGVARGGGALR